MLCTLKYFKIQDVCHCVIAFNLSPVRNRFCLDDSIWHRFNGLKLYKISN